MLLRAEPDVHIMASPLLLDREFLKTLEQVTLLCRTDLAGPAGPEHRSRMRGPGMEFADYRRYSFGDDPQPLDWSVYIRLGKLFLKIYQTEQHIPRVFCWIAANRWNGDDGESKFLYAEPARGYVRVFGALALRYDGQDSLFRGPAA